MEFMTFIAAIGVVLSTLIVGVITAGLHEVEEEDMEGSDSSQGLSLLSMTFIAVCTSLILVEPALIRPLWLQYVLLAGLPFVIGYVLRRVSARRSTGEEHR